jgi:hypothetical protein
VFIAFSIHQRSSSDGILVYRPTTSIDTTNALSGIPFSLNVPKYLGNQECPINKMGLKVPNL